MLPCILWSFTGVSWLLHKIYHLGVAVCMNKVTPHIFEKKLSKRAQLLSRFVSILLWIAIWTIAAKIIDRELFLPGSSFSLVIPLSAVRKQNFLAVCFKLNEKHTRRFFPCSFKRTYSLCCLIPAANRKRLHIASFKNNTHCSCCLIHNIGTAIGLI